MKKLYSIAAAFLICLPMCRLFAAAESMPALSAHAAILIEAGSGDIIYEKNSQEKLPMASTTKIMTALVALEEGDLSKPYRSRKAPAAWKDPASISPPEKN